MATVARSTSQPNRLKASYMSVGPHAKPSRVSCVVEARDSVESKSMSGVLEPGLMRLTLLDALFQLDSTRAGQGSMTIDAPVQRAHPVANEGIKDMSDPIDRAYERETKRDVWRRIGRSLTPATS